MISAYTVRVILELSPVFPDIFSQFWTFQLIPSCIYCSEINLIFCLIFKFYSYAFKDNFYNLHRLSPYY